MKELTLFSGTKVTIRTNEFQDFIITLKDYDMRDTDTNTVGLILTEEDITLLHNTITDLR